MRKYILLGIFGLLLLNSCSNDDFVWGGTDYVRLVGPEIWTLGTDSLTFSFTTYGEDVTDFTFDAELLIQGRTADYDRSVMLAVNDALTTATTSDYTFPSEVVIPAGEPSTTFGITVKRSEKLQEESIRLSVELVAGGDLDPGCEGYTTLTIVWNDMISKPTNWDSLLTEFFGTYSEVKYRFIISTLGISEFTYGESGGMTWGQMWNYHLEMCAALDEYNETHPEAMKDENGATISF